MTLSFTKIILGLAMLGFVASLSTGSLSRTSSDCDHVCPSPACDIKADRSIKQCKKCAECHAKQDAKFDTAAMVALVEDLADEASAEEPAAFSSEENIDGMDQSSRRRRWGHRHHRHHKHHPHTHHPHKHHTHVPHKHAPHAHTPHSHTVCQDGKTHGQEFIVYDAVGKYCYRAVIGQAVEQGSRDEDKCNKASFVKKILVGKGSGTSSAYTNGDSAHCDGPREATLTVTASTSAKSSSATVTEPSKCKYAIHMTVPKTCTTTNHKVDASAEMVALVDSAFSSEENIDGMDQSSRRRRWHAHRPIGFSGGGRRG